jgi:hypothetical protein
MSKVEVGSPRLFAAEDTPDPVIVRSTSFFPVNWKEKQQRKTHVPTKTGITAERW